VRARFRQFKCPYRDAVWCASTCLLLALALAACARDPAPLPDPDRLRIAGSTSMGPLIAELAHAYLERHPREYIELGGGGSAAGLEALQTGRIDLAAVSGGSSDPDETDRQAIPVARDGLVLVVHPGNPVRDVSLAQARNLFRGETLDWSALGELSGEPVIVSRENESGDRAAFEALVMDGERVTLNAVVMPNAQAVVDYVARHRNAVGYTSSGILTDGVRPLAVAGVKPDAGSIRSGAYPLSRILYLYGPEHLDRAPQAFVDFVLSPEGQRVVSRRYVSLP
jgi:phosphate transport system substrate-binding protein